MTTRRTVVRNHGNMNKGGSKTIFTYGSDGALKSTKNIRGKLGNKNGGMDNQYTINTTYTPTARTDHSTKTVSRVAQSNAGGEVSAATATIAVLLLPIIAAIGALFLFARVVADLITTSFLWVLNLIF